MIRELRTLGRWKRLACAGALAAVAAGCLTTPSTESPKLGPVDTGPGSLEGTRRMLAGEWSLARLEMVDANGVRTAVKAHGTLTYDAFGNLIIHGIIDEAPSERAVTLAYTGRIIIDPARREFYPQDFEPNTPPDPSRIAPVSLEKVRRYELTTGRFVVTYVDASGSPTAIATWVRPSR